MGGQDDGQNSGNGRIHGTDCFGSMLADGTAAKVKDALPAERPRPAPKPGSGGPAFPADGMDGGP